MNTKGAGLSLRQPWIRRKFKIANILREWLILVLSLTQLELNVASSAYKAESSL